MFHPVTEDTDISSNILWHYQWSDGSRLELTETQDNYILIEYDSDNNPIPYLVETGHSSFPSTEERYPKRRWKLHQVVSDIKDEYDLVI